MANAKDALRDLRNILATNVYRWKFKALDDSINKLKLHFPITDEMLEDIKHLTRERYTSANKAFRMAELKHYDNAHRWVPLMQKMAQEESLVHAIWDYVQDLANTRQHAAFRKSLMDICMEVGSNDFERLCENKPLSRTAAQRKMIVQSLVVQKRYMRTEAPAVGGGTVAYTPKPSRAATIAELRSKCDKMSNEMRHKDNTIARLQENGGGENLVIERGGSNLSRVGREYELDEDVASIPDSSESDLTPDSGFKSAGRTRDHGVHFPMETSHGDELDYAPDFDSDGLVLPRPKSVRGLRPKSAYGHPPKSASHKCLDCEQHVRQIERQRSDISTLTQTLETHERAFQSIKISVEQLLHPSADLGNTDTTNPHLLLSDINDTIRSLKSDIERNVSTSRQADEERERLQEMVDTLMADKLALESQKTVLERNWQESKIAHTRDIENHRRDIEHIKHDMKSMADTHKDELRQIVDEHKQELNDNREQFNSMMSVVMKKLNTSGGDGGGGAGFEPWANVSRSRVSSRGVSRSHSRAIAEEDEMERFDDDDGLEDEAAASWGSRAMSRSTRGGLSRNLSPDSESTKQHPPGIGQHNDESLILLHSRAQSRRKKKKARNFPETMRVSPDGDNSRSPLPTLRPSSQLGKYVDDNTQLLSHRDKDTSHAPLLAHREKDAAHVPIGLTPRENSFTTISDLTRRAGRKNMQA